MTTCKKSRLFPPVDSPDSLNRHQRFKLYWAGALERAERQRERNGSRNAHLRAVVRLLKSGGKLHAQKSPHIS